MSRMTKSACLPASRLPISFSFFKAVAACRVMPKIASAGVIRIWVQAMVVMRGGILGHAGAGVEVGGQGNRNPFSIIFRAGA